MNKFFLYVFFSLICYLYFLDLAHKTGISYIELSFNFLLFFGYLFSGVILYKKLVNPISIMLPLLLGYFYYPFSLSDRQIELDILTHTTVLSFLIFYFLGCLFSKYKVPRKNKAVNMSSSIVLITNLLFLLCVIIFLIESLMSGGFALILTIIYKVNMYSEMKRIPILHYLVMLASIFPAVYYHLYKNGFVGKRILKVVLAISIFILMNMLSRQIMILALLTFLFIYAKEKDLSIDKVMLKGIGYGAIIFFIIGSIRYAAINDGVSELEFMKAYSGVPKALNVNMFDVSFNLYTSMNFATLNEFVNNAGEMHYGINMFRPVIEIFKIDQAFNIYYDPKLNSFSLLATIVADPFLDFGLLGVIFLPFFYGIFISKVYLNYQVSKNLGHSLGWSICVYVMVMSVFTNFFNVLFIWICLLYSLLFIFKVTIKKARSTNDIK